MKKRYKVIVNKEPCDKCGQGAYWGILDKAADFEIYGAVADLEHVKEICDLLNEAFTAGKKEHKRK